MKPNPDANACMHTIRAHTYIHACIHACIHTFIYLLDVFHSQVGVATVKEVVGVVAVELCGHVKVLEAQLVLFHAQEG